MLATGVPVEVERTGQRLWIVPAEKAGRLGNISPHPEYLRSDPEWLVHLDGSGEWRP